MKPGFYRITSGYGTGEIVRLDFINRHGLADCRLARATPPYLACETIIVVRPENLEPVEESCANTLSWATQPPA